jgi:asparagine synthase (glutamine-hydrolysing)
MQYWSPSLNCKSDRAYDETVDEFRAIFQAAIKRHLMSDVPVASYLSAGFDSTMVASHAAKQLEVPPHSFTGRFEDGGWYDEAHGARLVADHIGAQITDVSIGSHDMRDHFDDVIFALDEPRMGMGAFPQYLVAKKAAQSHKLILTGHGGDELFSGYPVFKLAHLADTLKRSPEDLFKFALKLRASELPHIAYFGLRRIANGQDHSFLPELFSRQAQADGLLPQVNKALANARDISALDDLRSGSGTAFEHVLMTYLKIYLPGLLVVEDKISMAHSLESRTPFLDNDMLDFSLSITPGMKLHDGQLKAIIKCAACDVLPAALFEMPKRGFPTPLRHWLRGPLSEWMRNRICDPQSRLNLLFRREYLEKTTDNYLTSWRRKIRPLDEIQTHRMWMLLSLESWLRQYEERLGVTLEMDNRAAC